MNGIICLFRGHRPGDLVCIGFPHGDGKLYRTTLRACDRCGAPVMAVERAAENAVYLNVGEAYEDLKARIWAAVRQLDELLVDTEQIKGALSRVPKKPRVTPKLRRRVPNA